MINPCCGVCAQPLYHDQSVRLPLELTASPSLNSDAEFFIASCRHIFHRACANEWMKEPASTRQCPTCKFAAIENNIVGRHNAQGLPAFIQNFPHNQALNNEIDTLARFAGPF